MPITIECPACEEVFRISSKYRNKKGRCPHCDNSFVADENVITSFTETQASPSRPVPAPEPPLPSVVRREKQSHVPPLPGASLENSGSEDSGLEDPGPADASDLTQSDNASSLETARFPVSELGSLENVESTRSRGWSPMTMGISGAALMGLAIGITFLILAFGNPEKKTASVSDSVDETPIQAESLEDGSEKSTATLKGIPENEKPATMALSEWHRAWSEVQPYLVRLEIQSSRGNRTATGIIVDSRGWVATSYHAIQNAISVRTTLSPSLLENPDDQPAAKSDLARGLIAANPEYDLAIIQANRSLVMNMADIPFETENILVASQQVMVCQVPPENRKIWMTDPRIDSRVDPDALSAEQALAVKQLGYQVEPDFKWISLRQPQHSNFPGSAILDRKGRLVGMGIRWAAGSKESYCIPIEKVLALKTKISAAESLQAVKPFPQSDGIAENRNVIAAPANDLRPGEADFELFQNLNRAVDDCQAIDWLPGSPEAAAKFTTMADAMTSFPDNLRELTLDEDQRAASEKRFQKVCDRIQKSLDAIEYAWPADQVATANQAVLETTKDKPEAPVALIATVYRPSIFGPVLDGEKTVMFKIEGTKEILITKASQNHFEFRPGTRWMLIGRFQKTRNLKVNNSKGDSENCLFANIRISFELID